MKKIQIIIILIICIIPLHLFAETPQELLGRANGAYYKNQLEKAERLYEQLLDQDITSGHLYYNLGNVYFRRGKVGKAILYYEKALWLLPRNSDVRANLAFVQQKRIDHLPQKVGSRIAKGTFFWTSYLTMREAVIIFVALAAISWILATFFLLVRRGFFKWSTLIVGSMAIIFGLSLWFKYVVDVKSRWAIILYQEVAVRPTFMEKQKTLFKLHEGTKVKVISDQEFKEGGEWVQVQIPEGQKGWVRGEEVGII